MIPASEMSARYLADKTARETEARAEQERTRDAREAAAEVQRKLRAPPQRPMAEWLAQADTITRGKPGWVTSASMEVSDAETAKAVAAELGKSGYVAHTTKGTHYSVDWRWGTRELGGDNGHVMNPKGDPSIPPTVFGSPTKRGT